jgi:acetyl esterase/lipase
MTLTLRLLAASLMLAGGGGLFFCGTAVAAPPPGLKVVADFDYGGAGNPRQKLDLYLPEKPSKDLRPVIVFIHGGGWQGGSKEDGRVIFPLLDDGVYAGASIGYRLTGEAIWPAQVHDCKAALRWLAKHGAEHGLDTKRMALFGISAGGHLVSLLGTSQGVAALEGRVGVPDGREPVAPPSLAAVANYCGVANFLTFPGKGSTISEEDPKGPIAQLFGGPMSRHLGLARVASPVTYITSDDPPFLHIHGTKDELVPYAQVEEFDAALEKGGVPSTVLTGRDGSHVFVSEDLFRKLRVFFDQRLLGAKQAVEEGPVAIK